MKHIIVMVLTVCLLAIPLAACGKKSPPVAPEGSTYPNTYPTPQ